MTNIPDNIIEKIQKLINLKEGAEAVNSLAEAENAAAKLQDLLLKYNLDLEDVKEAQIKKRATEIHDDWIDLTDKQDKRESFWVPKLYGAIARHNMCRVLIEKNHVWILGEARNVQLILYICDQMVSKVRLAEKSAWKLYESMNGFEKRGTFRRGFFEGAAHGIDARLMSEMHNIRREQTNPLAVMVRNQMQKVNDYWEEKYVKPWEEMRKKQEEEDAEYERKHGKPPKRKEVKIRSKRELSSRDGWEAGRIAGTRMQINKGVEGNKSKANLE